MSCQRLNVTLLPRTSSIVGDPAEWLRQAAKIDVICETDPHSGLEAPMPAVTVSDLATLPEVPAPDRTSATERPVVSITTAPHGLEGEGFPVRRAFAGMSLPAGPLRAYGPNG